jgi:protocatechuate 3,4-dioxygenase beta subunit
LAHENPFAAGIAFGVDSLLHYEGRRERHFAENSDDFVVKTFFIFAIAISMFAALATRVSAQNAAADQATASISGTVVDAATSQPLKAANVWARSFQPGQGGRRSSSATTDAEGHFTLNGLIPGRYVVSASREDYVGRRSTNGLNAKLLTLAPDQHVDDILLQLTPGAIIAGHVKNADGKPLPGASVEILQYFYDGGQKQLHGVRAPTLSGSEGEYRITGLAAGHYYLRSSAPAPSESPKAENPKTSSKPSSKTSSKSSPERKEGYAPAYYPNTSDITRAVDLMIRPGQDLSGIDLTLASVLTVDVSGRVLLSGNSILAANAEVSLVDADGSPSSTRESTADAKGNFELHDVFPGSYVLLAQTDPQAKNGKALFGSKTIQVGKANIAKAEITVGPGTDVSGHIHLEDKVDDKAKVDLTRVSVELQPQGASSVTALMPPVDNAVVTADGSFQFIDVPEGTYLLRFSTLPAGYYAKATGGVDVLETVLTLGHNQPLPALDFTLSSKVARLDGDVSNSDQPASGAAVVLVPENGGATHVGDYRRSMTDQSGRFFMKGVIPGDYKVFAFEDLDRGASLNPDFLQPFEDRAQTVHLQEGADLNVRLEAIPASETSP